VLAEYGMLQFLDDKGGKNVRCVKKKGQVRKGWFEPRLKKA